MQSITVKSPGRINIIGDHTDYNEGFVLPAAINKSTVMKVEKNGTRSVVNFRALNFDQQYRFDLSDFNPLESGWQNYVMGVVAELSKYGAHLSGFNASFHGDIPIGAGLSSSAALECSLAVALNELFELELDKRQLITASQMAEHNFVGVKCGIMDQFASVMGKKDQTILLDCRSLDHRYYPVNLDLYKFILLNSNVSHELASSEYNTRRQECEQCVEILKKELPAVSSLRDVTLEFLHYTETSFPDHLYRRSLHVITENDRVLQAAHALEQGDFQFLGKLLYASHTSLRDNYQVSCPEIDFLVDQTKELDFVLGSRMMGGGFGGCTINLVDQAKSDDFVKYMRSKYRDRFDLDIASYCISIEDGTTRIS